MATAQLQRTQGKNWESIFPNEQVTEQKSALFVKKLLAVAISNITYLRAIFPEHAFGDKCLEDLNLKILRDESSCPGACQVIKWVKGCFDALDKKYLKTLIIGIYVDPNNPETVIESYTFKFAYNNDGEVDIYRNDKKISSAYSAEETKKATIRLLRTLIILTNTLTSLPDNVMMTMKLFYYDVTPLDYEPPGFKASNDHALHFIEETTNIAIGEVATPFHTVKMRVKTGSKQFEVHENPIEEMDQEMAEVSICNSGLDNEANNQNEAVEKEKIVSNKKEPISEPNPANHSSPLKPDKSPVRPETIEEEFSVRCPCGCNEDDGLMVMCANCNFWQHAVCFQIISEENAPTDHICDLCAKPGNSKLEPTDPHLCGLSSFAVQATCLWRRALLTSLEFKTLVAPQLARRLSIENTVAQGLINRLEKEGFLSSSNRGKRLGKIVLTEKIKTDAFDRYLKISKPPGKALVSNDTGLKVDDTHRTNMEEDKTVSMLVDKANKINLSGSKRVTRSSPAEEETPASLMTKDTRGKRGRKRAYSKTDNSEFEVANSQETQSSSTKKKASVVTKDIAV
ncbi:HORMA domain-containing protein 1-like [Physella acuta]|uniref:HORMA domain-containing protein 1-like n=1 Tax=Physella acuta TaxID=109671 RepID=UPI0027DBD0FA|nr:HORMA domain-containing protein 1-like [Physella acuta]